MHRKDSLKLLQELITFRAYDWHHPVISGNREYAPVKQFAAGERIVAQGDIAGRMFLVKKGSIKVTVQKISTTIVHTLAASDHPWFGFLDTLAHQPHEFTVMASSNPMASSIPTQENACVEVYELTGRDIDACIDDHQGLVTEAVVYSLTPQYLRRSLPRFPGLLLNRTYVQDKLHKVTRLLNRWKNLIAMLDRSNSGYLHYKARPQQRINQP